MFDVVMFDLDGTLINAYPAVEESVNFTLGHFGQAPAGSDAIKRAVGWGPAHLLKTFLGEGFLDEAIGVYQAHHQEALKTGSSLLPGAKEVLQALKEQGIKLAVASNRPKDFSLIVCECLGILPLFDKILCGDELEKGKPDPVILLHLVEQLGVSKERSLYVGDMAIDAQTGRNAGIKTVIVTTGSSSYEEIVKEEPWRIVERVDEVLRIKGLRIKD